MRWHLLSFLLLQIQCWASDNAQDTCLPPDGTYLSEQLFEAGLGVDNSKRYWSVKIQNSRFTWEYSDIQESGEISCTDKDTIIAHGHKQKIDVKFDPISGFLTWNQVKYLKPHVE